MKFLINFIVTYLVISLIGVFLWTYGQSTGLAALLLLADWIATLLIVTGASFALIGWEGYALLVTGKIIVCLVIAGVVSVFQKVVRRRDGNADGSRPKCS